MIDPKERAAGLARAFVHPACAVMRVHHLVAVVFSGHHDAKFVDVVTTSTTAGLGHAEPLALIIYLTPAAKPPDARARKQYTELMHRNAPGANGVAYVVPAKGFAGSIQRSVLVGINAVTRNAMATTVVADHRAAQAWFEGQGVRSSDAIELEHMVDALLEAQAQEAVKARSSG